MESLETKGSFDLQDTLQVPSLYRTSSMHSSRTSASEHQDCNGKTTPGLLVHQLHLDDARQDCDDGDDEGNMVRKCQVLIFGFFCSTKCYLYLSQECTGGCKAMVTARGGCHHQPRLRGSSRAAGAIGLWMLPEEGQALC